MQSPHRFEQVAGDASESMRFHWVRDGIIFRISRRTLSAWGLFVTSMMWLAAEQWPEFRGPTGQGLSKSQKPPLEWSPSKNIRWKAALSGSGWSSPVVVDNRIYLTTAAPIDGGSPSLHVSCFDFANGKQVWDVEIFASNPGAATRIHQKNSDASPTPIVAGGRLFVHFGHLGTACLDLDGKVIWRNTSIKYSPVHGNGGSPVLVGDLLVFSCDGGSDPFLVALDAKTGVARWKTPRSVSAPKRFSFSTPLVIEVGGELQIVSPASGGVCAYSPSTGQEIWRARYGDGYSVIPRPVFGHGMVFLATGYDRPNAMAVRVDGKGDVTDTHVAWSVSRGAPHTPSLVLDGEELYMVSDAGIASCLDAKNGTTIWSERLGGNFSASPVLAAGRVYFQNEEGVGFVVKAGRRYELLARNDVQERTLASPAFVGDSIVLRGSAHLYRFDAP